MSARFADGDTVRICDLGLTGHMRTPAYVRGKEGRIERLCGAYPNPEALAYGRDGLPEVPLYRVRLAQRDLWPAYPGNAADTLDIEIYEHWLEHAP